MAKVFAENGWDVTCGKILIKIFNIFRYDESNSILAKYFASDVKRSGGSKIFLRGHQLPKRVCWSIIFQIFYHKLHENERIWIGGGGHFPGAPLDRQWSRATNQALNILQKEHSLLSGQ